MTCLKPLLPFSLLVLATPALAQVDMSLMPEEPSSDESSMELSLSEEPSSEPSSMSGPPVFSMPEEPSSSSSSIRMSVPPVFSSEEPPPPPPAIGAAEAFQIFYDACTSISGGEPDAYDKANDAGWVPYEGSEYGPYKQVYTGSRDFEGYGSVEIWGSLESYPTQALGYCRVDFGDYNNSFDFSQIAGIGGLTGTVAEGGANAVWESADKKLLVIAARYDGSVSIEFNVLVGDRPAP